MIPATTTEVLDNLIKDNFNFGLADYIIHDENYRIILNNKILDHYRYEEINFETPALFKHYLNIRMNEIMPKYKQLYQSLVLNIDYFSNYKLNETHTKNTDGSTTGSSTSTSTGTNNSTSSQTQENENKHVLQDTPQGELSSQDIDNFTYATEHQFDKTTDSSSTTKNDSTSLSDGTNTNSSMTTVEEYINNISGNKGLDPNILLKEYRSNFLNIDLDIINELHDLFLQVY